MKWALYNLTATTTVGGMETSVWWLARALMNRGRQVTVYGGESRRELPQAAQGVPKRVFPFKDRKDFINLGTRARKLLERLSFARAAMPALVADQPDRLLIFKPYDIFPALWARKRCGAPAGLYSGGVEPYPLAGRLAARLDYRAAFSQYNANRMEEAMGVAVAVNYPGVDTSRFRPGPPDPDLAREYKIAPNDPVAVMAVRLVGWKGVQDAVAAVGLLSSKWPGLRLLVAGEGPFRTELESQIKSLGLQSRVGLVGFLDPNRLAGFYALGRVALFPSRGEEALGLSIAEAMACGLATIGADQGGIPEVIGEGGGILTPPGDAPALADNLDKLLSDDGLRASLAAAGMARARRVFNWDACAARLEQGLADEGP